MYSFFMTIIRPRSGLLILRRIHQISSDSSPQSPSEWALVDEMLNENGELLRDTHTIHLCCCQTQRIKNSWQEIETEDNDRSTDMYKTY